MKQVALSQESFLEQFCKHFYNKFFQYGFCTFFENLRLFVFPRFFRPLLTLENVCPWGGGHCNEENQPRKQYNNLHRNSITILT